MLHSPSIRGDQSRESGRIDPIREDLRPRIRKSQRRKALVETRGAAVKLVFTTIPSDSIQNLEAEGGMKKAKA